MPAELSSKDIEERFHALAELEKDFEKTDLEILRETFTKQAPLFERRNAVTSTIPGFWQHVFDEASSSIGLEEHIHPEDTVVLSALTSLNVTRPGAANGDPRDLEFTFEFADNDYMPAQTLVKKFKYQEGAVTLLGQTGLVSEPVLVQFKKGKDLTSGLSAAAMEAWEERKSKKDLKGAQKRKVGEKEKKLAALVDKATSFFCWFSYTGAHKDLGEVLDEDEEEEEENEDDAAEENVSMMSPVEAFSYGDEVAIQLAEDLYPNAVKYFTASLEDGDDEDDEDEDIDLEDDSEAEEVLAKLVASTDKAKGSKKKSKRDENEGDMPAKKKAKK